MTLSPDMTTAITAEGQRRLALLGPTITLRQSESADLDQIRQRARLVEVC